MSYPTTPLDRALDRSIAAENRGERPAPGECPVTDSLNDFLAQPVSAIITQEVLSKMDPDAAARLRDRFNL